MKRRSMKTIAVAILAILACSVGLTQTGCKGRTDNSVVQKVTDPVHQQLLNELALTMTTEQKIHVSAILATHEQNVAQWSAINGPKLVQLEAIIGTYHGPRAEGSEKDIKAARNESFKLETERRDMDTQLLANMRAALSEQQFAQAKEILNPTPPPWAMGPTNKFHFLGQLSLTEQQLGTIKAIMAEAKESLETPSGAPMAGAGAMEAAWERIVNEALTDENRALLGDLMQRDRDQRMVLASFTAEMRLSAVQTANIMTIFDQAYAAGKLADRGMKFSIYEAALDEITTNVLNDEQREQMGATQGEAMGQMPPQGGMPPMPPAEGGQEAPDDHDH